MVQCDGCKGFFKTSGYRFHLRQTTNPKCVAIYQESITLPVLDPDFGTESDPDPGSPMVETDGDPFDLPPMPFIGDFFGDDYTGADLGLEYDDAEESLDEGGDDDEAIGAQDAVFEDGWEPDRAPITLNEESLFHSAPTPEDSSLFEAVQHAHARSEIADHLRQKPVVVPFPGGMAGRPLSSASPTQYGEQAYQAQLNDPLNEWAPFQTRMDWEIARWAKVRGPSSTAFSELLKIEGVLDALGLSYRNSTELNKIIDKKLPGRPSFKRREVVISGEAFEVYFRDIIECIRALWGDTDFAPHLIITPERHYADADCTVRMYHNMHTGKWWWATQAAVEKEHPGATIIPIIISSDKTLLTSFGNKTAYPVYMTIGNIPKEIRRKPSRRGYILLGYLPTSRLLHIKNKAARRRTLANLFHTCMKRILAPIRGPGVDGMTVVSGDGVARRGHPIFATYVGDYPEQVLVTAVKNGDCPTCPTPHDELGDAEGDFSPRDLDKVLAALDTYTEGPTIYSKACRDAGIKPVVHPFWEGLPYVHIFRSIASDILHQLYQGIVKHLIAWLILCCGKDEIDARCRRLPPNHNNRLFMKGISMLSRVTGKEHEQMCHFLLGIIIDIRLPNNLSPDRLIRAVRGILDFLFLAQYPLHTSETLSSLKSALKSFHDNKEVFVDLGIRTQFNIPKLHSCQHYPMYIELFGTTDNYNTEYTERLHIELAKDAYRATNFKDELPQMTLWLERREKMSRHEKFMLWCAAGCPSTAVSGIDVVPGIAYERTLKMTLHPSKKAVRIAEIQIDYKAVYFRDALTRYIVQCREPGLTNAEIERRASYFSLPFNHVPVFHFIKYTTPDPYKFADDPNTITIVDSVHVRPEATNKKGDPIPGRFDTVLVNDGTGALTGVKGYRVAQVRVVFALPRKALEALFDPAIAAAIPPYLAYVEWFTAFPSCPEPNHLMYKIKRARKNGLPRASIIPVSNIRRSVHLLPKFGPVAQKEWTSSNVLELCPNFHLSPFTDRHAYFTIF